MEHDVGRDDRARAASSPAVQAGGPRILLVEDDEDTRQLLAVALGGERYAVDAAATAPDALELLRRNHYDLVLTDYDLPGQTGSSMLKAAAAEGLLGDAATIVVTAHPQPEGVAPADVIQKPFDLRAFLRQVRHILVSMDGQRPESSVAPPPPSDLAGLPGGPVVELVLYVSADSPPSQRARRHLETVLSSCEPGQVRLEVCDVARGPRARRGGSRRLHADPGRALRRAGDLGSR